MTVCYSSGLAYSGLRSIGLGFSVNWGQFDCYSRKSDFPVTAKTFDLLLDFVDCFELEN